MKFLALLSCCISWLHASEHATRDAWVAKHGGEAEVRLADGTRADIVTDRHAVEVEFAEKWHQAVGQALWYAYQTNKKPGILLVYRKPEDKRYLIRLNSLISHYNLAITVATTREIKIPKTAKK